MQLSRLSCGLLIFVVLAGPSFAQPKPNLRNEPLTGPGELPKGDDGQPLNTNF